MTRVVLAGGGTAGHTSPLIATAEALRALDPAVAISCMGTPKGLEVRVIPAAGLELDLIPAVPLPRRPGKDLATLPVRLGLAVRQARAVLVQRRAQVVAGFGGYASLPAYLAARSLGLPVVVHEQNALPGLANKIAAAFASVVAVSFPNTGLRNQVYVGLPVRKAIAALDRASLRDEAREALALPSDGRVLLVSGGSQGAMRLNVAVAGAADRLLAQGVSVLHVLGAKNFDSSRHVRREREGAAYVPVSYVDRMEEAYAAADLMVGRSGAGTVVETAVVGLPSLFVPLPHGNGEQAKNAEALVAVGGARLVADADLTPDRLIAEVIPILSDPARLERMAAAGRGLVPGDAAERLAAMILGEVR